MKITRIAPYLKKLVSPRVDWPTLIVNGTEDEIKEVESWLLESDIKYEKRVRYGGVSQDRKEKFNLDVSFEEDYGAVALVLRWSDEALLV